MKQAMESSRNEGAGTWRPAAASDLLDIQRIGDQIHPNLHERPEVFAERLRAARCRCSTGWCITTLGGLPNGVARSASARTSRTTRPCSWTATSTRDPSVAQSALPPAAERDGGCRRTVGRARQQERGRSQRPADPGQRPGEILERVSVKRTRAWAAFLVAAAAAGRDPRRGTGGQAAQGDDCQHGEAFPSARSHVPSSVGGKASDRVCRPPPRPLARSFHLR
jgi:hypothetical protein